MFKIENVMSNNKANSIFASSVVVLLALDAIYLYFFGANHYGKLITSIQGSKMTVKILPVALCYILLILGLNFFILTPRRSVGAAFVLGIMVYGVYELTSYAIVKDWTIGTVFIDTLWGGILLAATTWITYYAYDRRSLDKTI